MGSKQLGFGDDEQTTAKKGTRSKSLLAEMEKVMRLGDISGPHLIHCRDHAEIRQAWKTLKRIPGHWGAG
jgi:hypothetical protein